MKFKKHYLYKQKNFYEHVPKRNIEIYLHSLDCWKNRIFKMTPRKRYFFLLLHHKKDIFFAYSFDLISCEMPSFFFVKKFFMKYLRSFWNLPWKFNFLGPLFNYVCKKYAISGERIIFSPDFFVEIWKKKGIFSFLSNFHKD